MAFKLTDTNRFALPGTSERFIHMATVHNGIREFICFIDRYNVKTYIEEVTGGHLEYISDDELAKALSDFLTDQGVLDMSKPAVPDNQWYIKK